MFYKEYSNDLSAVIARILLSLCYSTTNFLYSGEAPSSKIVKQRLKL